MCRKWLQGLLLVVALAFAAAVPASVQNAEDIDARNEETERLYAAGLHDATLSYAQETLALAEASLGADHPQTLASVNNLAALYRAMGRYEEAELLYARALEGYERVLGVDHPSTLVSVNNLAGLYDVMGRYDDAEALYARALEGRERVLGADHPDTLLSVNNLVALYHAMGRYEEAEPLLLQALEGAERVLGADHPQTLASVNNLAALYRAMGRYEEAEPLYARALEGRERVLGADHSDTLVSVSDLAGLYRIMGRYGDAEPLYLRALEVSERVRGADHLDTLFLVNHLALLYQSIGRNADAYPLYIRALNGHERALGTEHPFVLASVGNLASFYLATGRYGDAEPLYLRALEVSERVLGPDHPDTLRSVSNLADLYHATSHYGDAEALYLRALEMSERLLGAEHSTTLGSVSKLADLYHAAGHYGDAEALYLRALEMSERLLGAEHPGTLNVLQSYWAVRADGGRELTVRPHALELLGEAMAQLDVGLTDRALDHPELWVETLARLDIGFADGAPDLVTLSSRTTSKNQARNILAAYRHSLSAGDVTADDQAFLEPAFRLTQGFHASSVGEALAAAVARLALDDAEKRRLVRERESGTSALVSLERMLAEQRSRPAERRHVEDEAELERQIEIAQIELRNIGDALGRDDEDFAELVASMVEGADDRSALRAALATREALIFYASTPANGDYLAFVLTPGNAVAVPIDASAMALGVNIARLREGVRIRSGLTAADLPAYDLALATELYATLIDPLTAHLGDATRLFIVADGPLASLPFAALVVESGDAALAPFARYRATHWLADDYAVAVLPTVSSFVRLRDSHSQAQGDRPLLAFGDPVMGGEARDAPAEPEIDLVALNAELKLLGGDGDPDALGSLPPIPETAALVEAIAEALDAGRRDIYLGEDAQEADLHFLQAQDRLKRYRLIAFATHALVAGDSLGSVGLIEPALVLSRPDGDNLPASNDGLLRASEVVTLDLDADMVILAACNTAAADGSPGAEALSGLAKAFFNAGARSLLVSHWPAEATATAALVPAMVEEMDAGTPRADALQHAMADLRTDEAHPHYAHPALWAAFMVVGEGG